MSEYSAHKPPRTKTQASVTATESMKTSLWRENYKYWTHSTLSFCHRGYGEAINIVLQKASLPLGREMGPASDTVLAACSVIIFPSYVSNTTYSGDTLIQGPCREIFFPQLIRSIVRKGYIETYYYCSLLIFISLLLICSFKKKCPLPSPASLIRTRILHGQKLIWSTDSWLPVEIQCTTLCSISQLVSL